MKQLLSAVYTIHASGFVHRDIKAENIMFSKKNSYATIKLIDFGCASEIKPGQLLHKMFGSPYYIAPEIFAGQGYG